MSTPQKTAVAVAMAFSAPAVLAQSVATAPQPVELPPVVVTANPLGSGLFDLVPPVSATIDQPLPLIAGRIFKRGQRGQGNGAGASPTGRQHGQMNPTVTSLRGGGDGFRLTSARVAMAHWASTLSCGVELQQQILADLTKK